ncbi:TPA: hypothetical protein ACX3GU_004645 [Vibrio parahaemolyticus]
MNVAFLFNSDHPSLEMFYGMAILEKVLASGELQKSSRFMRVSIGDILTYGMSAGKTYDQLEELCHKVYVPNNYDRLNWNALRATYRTATVYCLLFQNMAESNAEELHNTLRVSEPSYLGAMDVDFSKPLQLRLFRNSLCEVYRLKNSHVNLFTDLDNVDGFDCFSKGVFEGQGFTTSFENMGARRTYWDKFDTLEHFKRISDFKRIFLTMDNVSEDLASDVIHSLEELHPKLFDKFASAARAMERVETEEDLAQAALSGRRVLESFADYLYPPRKESYKGRKVGNAEYKNRLWAYIETTLDDMEDPLKESKLSTLGREADDLVKLFNAGLHANPCKKSIEQAFSRQLQWIQAIIELSPENARKPYLAYEDELKAAVINKFT